MGSIRRDNGFGRVEAAGVEAVVGRGDPRSIEGFAHAVIGLEAPRVLGIDEIVPIAHFKQVGTLVSAGVHMGGIERRMNLPMV